MEVSEDQQSLAIGKGGQNARLAAKLTSWKIDIQSAKGEDAVSTDGEDVKIVKTKNRARIPESKESPWMETWMERTV